MKFLDQPPRYLFFTGKGGVGKTSIACATAVQLADEGKKVLLVSTDPASNVGQVFGISIGNQITAVPTVPRLAALEIDPQAAAQVYRDRIVGPAAHLSETLSGTLDNLTVSRIDPHAETERYRQHVLDTKGAQLDAQGRALLEEDLRSPCTEEIAVFQAFSRIIREAGKKYVVMDTAPTGHTLLLLDATGAYHREVTRQMEDSGLHFTTPMMQLQDPKQTKVLIVTLAEPTPVLEAASLQADLRRAGIEPWAWIINSSVAAASAKSPLLRRRAANELREIDVVATQHAQRYAVVPLLKEEPVGVERLLNLARNN